MIADISVIWLEPATQITKTEEHLSAKVFVNSCSSLGIERKNITSLREVSTEPIAEADAKDLVLITGEAGTRKRNFFLELGRRLREAGRSPIFVIDALTGLEADAKEGLLSSLQAEQFKVSTQESTIHLLRTPKEFLAAWV